MSDDIIVEPGISGITVSWGAVLRERAEDLRFQFSYAHDTPDEVVNAQLDRMRKAAERQKAIMEIPMFVQALNVARQMPEQLGKEIDDNRRAKAAYQAGLSVRNENRRNAARMTEHDKTELEKFDVLIRQAQRAQKHAEHDIPKAEWELARRIAIRDGTPTPPEPQAMAEDVAGIEVIRRMAAE